MDKRIEFIDFLNVFSCIAVIALHCNGCFWHFSNADWWKTSVFIECFFYWAVPCFFMITGATLVDYRKAYDTKEYFRKRFWRAVFPFLIWSLLWLDATVMFKGKSFIGIIELILNTSPNNVYWFFPALFSVYLAIPVLGLIEQEKKIIAFKYMAILSLVLESTMPLLCKLLHIRWNYSLSNMMGGEYILYVLIGYLLLNYYNHLNLKERLWIYLLGFTGFFARFYTVLTWSLQDSKINNTWGVICLFRQYFSRFPYSFSFSMILLS